MSKEGDPDNPAYEPRTRRIIETQTSMARLLNHDFLRAQAVSDQRQLQLEQQERHAIEQQGRIAVFEKQVADSRAQRLTLERQLQVRETDLSAAQERTKDFEKRVADSRVQRLTLERQLEVRETDISAAQERIKAFEKEVTDARVQRLTLERQLEVRETDLSAAQERIHAFEKEVADARVQRLTLERHLEVRKSEESKALARLANCEQELAATWMHREKLERQLQLRSGEVSHTQGRLDDLKKELAEVRLQRDTLEKEYQSSERSTTDVKRKISDYESELAQVHGLIEERDNKLHELQANADQIWMQLEREREQAGSRTSVLEKDLADAHRLVDESQGQLVELQQTADQIWTQLETERAETKARFDRIHATYSWRVTRPLRTLLDSLMTTQHRLIALRRKLRRKLEFRLLNRTSRKHRSTEIAPVEAHAPTVERLAMPQSSTSSATDSPKLIAFYLPQFHPIPENDKWWGKGFTEWTNVAKAKALYEGHHQPRRPSDLGYYDLRLPEVREAQAELARAHGIHGFCYHYYWFDRGRLLERPLDDMLDSGRPDFPFCLCWANESWTRRWDGSEKDILMAQNYDEGFAGRFAEDVVRYLTDPRYIRVGDRPLLIVYRIDQIPNIEEVLETWRQVFRDQGVGEVFLGAVECFDMTNPTRFGFDGAIEFPPHNPPLAENRPLDPGRRMRVNNLDPEFSGLLRDYRDAVRARTAMQPVGYPLFRGVIPSWDNTARSGPRALIYHHASPEAYQEWLTAALRSSAAFSAPHEPVVFVNAWNEWAEGAYLEPDEEHGHDYLLATKAALESVGVHVSKPEASVNGRWQEQPHPAVSIIIPAFNQAHLTRLCLDSLHRHAASLPFEVLLVDDASTDDTPLIADEMPWVRCFRQEQNGGFGAACNFGATKARGEYLVFLNNDTTVSEGWLDALRETFDNWPKAGLVGSKLVLTDGTMQECGSLLFRDGSAANYGRGGDPRDPRYCYARETDYVSGAAIMIRKDMFDSLNGFDDLYEPAYYEDTDLALRIRERGLQVVVNPHAEVTHVEGGTAGTDTSKGIKRYQVINQAKFLDRWRETLAHFPVRPSDEPGLRRLGPKVLVIDWIIPRPDRDSGSLRMTGILRALRALDCHVTVAARDMSCETGYELPLEKVGIEVLRRPYIASVDRYLAENGGDFDYVIVSRRDTANLHIDSVTRYCTNARIIFDTCDLHFIRESRQAEIDGTKVSARELESMKALELDLIQSSDTTLVVSPEERDVLKEMLPEHDIRIVSNILDVQPTERGFSERKGLLFIGWFLHKPNLDGVLWFIKEVLPDLADRGLEPVFHVVGSDPPQELLSLESEQIKIHGYVPNVEPLFDASRLSVAPLRYGAGVKGKINQSLALGVPCVTTTIGAEGVFIENEVNGMVADAASDFASAIERAYKSEQLWSKLREEGLRNIEQHFSPEVATSVLRDIIV
jgi:GT2 family glycosyltransferase/glycosyltransferase involved in cell wall biosynthesis